MLPRDARVGERHPEHERQRGLQMTAEPIAIVGMGVRVPGRANTPETFWEMLMAGRSAVSSPPFERRRTLHGTETMWVSGGFLRGIEEFDAYFFGISAREAKSMDPLHRHLLEVGWQAVENGGHAGSLSSRTGVFVGMMNQQEYGKLLMQSRGTNYADDPYYGTGTSSSMAAGRLSTFLDARGPSVTIDTACSSSLVAVHLACRSLRSKECDAALVVGVNALVLPESFMYSNRMGMLSPTGQSVPFQASANGIVLGEGCGAVFLERLSAARSHGHRIYGLLSGTAINHDGISHERLTPNAKAQSDVIRQALLDAGRKPTDIAFVEAHGASTAKGDVCELDSLMEVFADARRLFPLLTGSVKANIGHLVGGAGVIGLIKTALSISHRQIPPDPSSPGYVLRPGTVMSPILAEAGPWPSGIRCVAGVSSFGWGGTNAHVIVEEAPEPEPTGRGRDVQLLVLSARTPGALEEATRQLARHLRENSELELADVAYTLQMGRKAWEHRRAVVCRTAAEAIAALEAAATHTMTGQSTTEQSGPDVRVDAGQLWWSRGASEQVEWDLTALLEQVGRQWVSGAKVDWTGLYGSERRQRVSLPTYPFERKRYWIETKTEGTASRQGLLAQEPEKKNEIADWLYVPSWKKAFPIKAAACETGAWLIAGGEELGMAMAERLRCRGESVITVESGVAFEEITDDRYVIRLGAREDYSAVLAALRRRGSRIGRVVHMWLAEPAARWSAREEDTVEGAMERGFYALIALVQALGEQPSAEHVHVTIVTSELQDVMSGETVCAAKALVTGPCLVVPQEYRQIHCRSVDVAVHEVNKPTESFITLLEQELRRETDETTVALRGADRWVQDVAAARLLVNRNPRGLREKGVYLITGGLGGIGLAVAEYLYRRVDARLVLVGRTAGRNQERLSALRRAGANLLVRTADVSDRAQMTRVVEEAEARFGALHGVIHAAGVPPSGLIQRKTHEMAEVVMRPKVRGVLVLADVFHDRDLDFLCLFSSISSMTGGGPGQIDYCAANAFMDAYARQHFHEHGMTFSIAWCEWQWNAWEEGLTGFPEEARRYFIEKRQTFGLSFDEGTEAFGRILDHRIPSTFVVTQDFAQILEGSRNFSVTTILEAVKRMRGPRPAHARPALAVSYVAPATDEERRLAQIWSDLLGFTDVGVHDNFFELGGNSLLGVDLIARIGSEFNLPAVPAHLLYQSPTIATLARAISSGRRTSQPVEEDWAVRTQKRRETLRRMRQGA